jgi:hypothetical protein
MIMKDPRPPWRKSTYSNASSNCVEVAGQPGTVAVRDTKDPHGPALAFSPAGWRAFTRHVKAGATETI